MLLAGLPDNWKSRCDGHGYPKAANNEALTVPALGTYLGRISVAGTPETTKVNVTLTLPCSHLFCIPRRRPGQTADSKTDEVAFVAQLLHRYTRAIARIILNFTI
jgi:hypothetical protein